MKCITSLLNSGNQTDVLNPFSIVCVATEVRLVEGIRSVLGVCSSRDSHSCEYTYTVLEMCLAAGFSLET